jgi:arsenate reductase
MKNILFLCTGNSARSVLAECWTNHVGGDKWRGWSAGSFPTGIPNPFALKTLEAHGITPVAGDGGVPRSKSWDEFAASDAPIMDVVVTVCDNAAGEVCPIWPVRQGGVPPRKFHWGFPDPAAVEGTDDEKLAAFETVFTDVRAQLDAFFAEEAAA